MSWKFRTRGVLHPKNDMIYKNLRCTGQKTFFGSNRQVLKSRTGIK